MNVKYTCSFISLSLSLPLPQVACGFEDCVETLLNAQADSSAKSVTNDITYNIVIQ